MAPETGRDHRKCINTRLMFGTGGHNVTLLTRPIDRRLHTKSLTRLKKTTIIATPFWSLHTLVNNVDLRWRMATNLRTLFARDWFCVEVVVWTYITYSIYRHHFRKGDTGLCLTNTLYGSDIIIQSRRPTSKWSKHCETWCTSKTAKSENWPHIPCTHTGIFLHQSWSWAGSIHSWVGLGCVKDDGAPHPNRAYWWCIHSEYFIPVH